MDSGPAPSGASRNDGVVWLPVIANAKRVGMHVEAENVVFEKSLE